MIEFSVLGTPVPQGSMKAFIINGRANVVPDNGPKLKAWRKAIAAAARAQTTDPPFNGPVQVRVRFCRRTPNTRLGDYYDDTGPDLDKLLRAILDGITGVLITNDARVVMSSQEKVFTDGDEKAIVQVRPLNPTSSKN